MSAAEKPGPALPAGTVRALIGSGRLTGATRNALEARLEAAPAGEPRYLDADAFALLRVLCEQLLGAQGGAACEPEVDIAGLIDARLAEGRGDGWRYDAMPADGEAFRIGLAAIDETAMAIGGKPFVALDARAREQVIQAVQRGDPPGPAWGALPAARFFADLLAEAAETYFAHPLVQERIGYLGFADVLGWHAIGLDQAEQPEPAAPRRA